MFAVLCCSPRIPLCLDSLVVRAPSEAAGDPGSSPGQDQEYERTAGLSMFSLLIDETPSAPFLRCFSLLSSSNKFLECNVIESAILQRPLPTVFSPPPHPRPTALTRFLFRFASVWLLLVIFSLGYWMSSPWASSTEGTSQPSAPPWKESDADFLWSHHSQFLV